MARASVYLCFPIHAAVTVNAFLKKKKKKKKKKKL